MPQQPATASARGGGVKTFMQTLRDPFLELKKIPAENSGAIQWMPVQQAGSGAVVCA